MNECAVVPAPSALGLRAHRLPSLALHRRGHLDTWQVYYAVPAVDLAVHWVLLGEPSWNKTGLQPKARGRVRGL